MTRKVAWERAHGVWMPRVTVNGSCGECGVRANFERGTPNQSGAALMQRE